MAIGQSKQRLDAEAKVTGRARYTDDMGLPGMRHAAYVHSTIAHGMVLSIDASEALALPASRPSSPPMTCRASSSPQPDIPTPWTRRTETWPTAFC